MLPLPLSLVFGKEITVLTKGKNTSDGSSGTPVATAVLAEGRILEHNTLPGPSDDTTIPSLPLTADTSFSVEIPFLELSQTIIAEVDPSSKQEYLPVMESYIAHGRYTAFPTDPDGNVYLFAHSKKAPAGITPTGAWFTRIDELKTGDAIIISYHGQTYTYTVTTSLIVDTKDTYVYQSSSVYPGHRSITLQTCYPRGETLQRLIVRGIGE